MDTKTKENNVIIPKKYSYIRIETADEDYVSEWLDGQQINYTADQSSDLFLVEEYLEQNISKLLMKDFNKPNKELSKNMQEKINDFIWYNEDNEARISLVEDICCTTVDKIRSTIKKEVNNICKNNDRYKKLLADWIKEGEL